MTIYLTENECYMEYAQGIGALRLHFAGTAFIEDLTPNDYMLCIRDKIIHIHKYTRTGKANLEYLFNYKGLLNISKAQAIFTDGTMGYIRVVNKKYKYISQNLNIKSEDMSLLSEEMNIKKPLKVQKTSLAINVINNLNSTGNRFFNKDGSGYNGLMHYYLDGSRKFKYYTGGTSTIDSKLLFTKKIGKIIKPAAISKEIRENYLILERNKGKRNAIY